MKFEFQFTIIRDPSSPVFKGSYNKIEIYISILLYDNCLTMSYIGIILYDNFVLQIVIQDYSVL